MDRWLKMVEVRKMPRKHRGESREERRKRGKAFHDEKAQGASSQSRLLEPSPGTTVSSEDFYKRKKEKDELKGK